MKFSTKKKNPQSVLFFRKNDYYRTRTAKRHCNRKRSIAFEKNALFACNGWLIQNKYGFSPLKRRCWTFRIYHDCFILTLVAPCRVNFQDPDNGFAVMTRYRSTAMVDSVTIDTKPNWPTPNAYSVHPMGTKHDYETIRTRWTQRFEWKLFENFSYKNHSSTVDK